MTGMFDYSDPALRLGIFIGVFAVMAALEWILPRKSRVMPRTGRWFTNISLIIVDTLTLRLVMPVLAVGMAIIAERSGWGLFNLTDWPIWLELISAVIIFDLLIYGQHVLMHQWPFLWRMHKVHHTDRDLDVTSGARFHPFEIILSMAYKLAAVALIGPAALAVFLYEIILNAASMFNHANVKIPTALDRVVRAIIVTPDMHRVHHSVLMRETNSNYGNLLSIWDRLFRTYRDQPENGHDEMIIGLAEYQDANPAKLWWSLALPFGPDGGQKKGGGQ